MHKTVKAKLFVVTFVTRKPSIAHDFVFDFGPSAG